MGDDSAANPAPPEGRAEQPAQKAANGRSNGNGRGKNGQSNKKKFVGRSEWRRQKTEKRKQLNDDWATKRRKLNDNGDAEGGSGEKVDPRKSNPFSAEEIASEERRPKKKVAVMIGYSGTGYKGMQINWEERTIEGDLFKAFVAAGAISKANADDPKKSSLARCARTDKGVHAAGNVISLKLIIEDEDIVQKINANLPEQIRVWGIQRTSNSFNCYQSCDSRWYEYLLPTYCLLPPHPRSYMWKKLIGSAKEKNCLEEFEARLADVKGFWEDVEEKSIKPILERLDPQVRIEVLERLHALEEAEAVETAKKADKADDEVQSSEEAEAAPAAEAPAATSAESAAEAAPVTAEQVETGNIPNAPPSKKPKTKELGPVDFALRDIKEAYIKAKRDYRVTPERLNQLQEALNQYVGTVNFHNYTIQKSFSDASAKRHIKSFQTNMTPIQIRDTQWVSLKVHGQSFMMHQIRKMVSMATLVVRSATPLQRMKESFEETRIAIPKAPGLGLLLERPVFEGYSRKAVDTLGRDPIDFGKFDDELQAFKDRQIYQRIFELEEEENSFHDFFQQIDNFKSDYFLWLTAGGIEAGALHNAASGKDEKAIDAGLGDADEDPEGGEG